MKKMVLVYKRSSNMMDSPKKLSNGSMHFSYNLQEGRSPKNLSNSITPEASKNLNYRADKQNYIAGSDDAFVYSKRQIEKDFASISRTFWPFLMIFSKFRS